MRSVNTLISNEASGIYGARIYSEFDMLFGATTACEMPRHVDIDRLRALAYREINKFQKLIQ